MPLSLRIKQYTLLNILPSECSTLNVIIKLRLIHPGTHFARLLWMLPSIFDNFAHFDFDICIFMEFSIDSAFCNSPRLSYEDMASWALALCNDIFERLTPSHGYIVILCFWLSLSFRNFNAVICFRTFNRTSIQKHTEKKAQIRHSNNLFSIWVCAYNSQATSSNSNLSNVCHFFSHIHFVFPQT